LKKIDITLVICNYNHGKYLERNLLSFLNQTFPPKKIIIIDDGSADESAKIIRNLDRKYSSVKGIIKYINKGIIFRMNQSLRMIDTSHFIHFGADDFLVINNCLELMRNQILKYPNAGVCSGLTIQVDKNGRFLRYIRSPIVSNVSYYISPDKVEKIMTTFGFWINSHPAIINTDFFKKIIVKYPDNHQYTDIESYYKIAFKKGALFVPRILGAYTLQNKQWSIQGFKSKENNKNLKKMLQSWSCLEEVKNISNISSTLAILRKYRDTKNKMIGKNCVIKFFLLLFGLINFFISNKNFFFYYHYSRLPNKKIAKEINFLKEKLS